MFQFAEEVDFEFQKTNGISATNFCFHWWTHNEHEDRWFYLRAQISTVERKQ